MDDRKPSDTAERIVVRLPDGMRDRLGVLARGNNRSVNAEVTKALEAWLASGSEREASFLIGLPEATRGFLERRAAKAGRTPFEEAISRLNNSFVPSPPRTPQLDMAEISDVVQTAVGTAIDRLLNDPIFLERMGYVRINDVGE